MSDQGHTTHPTTAMYWKIAVLLAVLTAIEVSLYYIDNALDLAIFNTLILLGLSTLKFLIVVGFYMHLRYEKSTLSRFFTAGFVLACCVYAIVIAALGGLATL